MARYVKNPIEIDAEQYTGNNKLHIERFVGKELLESKPTSAHERELDNIPNEASSLIIPTLEGNMTCSKFDYVIKGIKGEFYPCKPDIFEASYTKVNE